MRNHFAHKYSARSFDEQPAREWCSSLRQPSLMEQATSKVLPTAMAQQAREYVQLVTASSRQKYEMTVFGLFGSLLRRLNVVPRIETSMWFSDDSDRELTPS